MVQIRACLQPEKTVAFLLIAKEPRFALNQRQGLCRERVDCLLSTEGKAAEELYSLHAYTSKSKVSKWAFRVMKKFRLGGFLILKSSANCYHIVFDRPVSWSENVKIVSWVSLYSRNVKLDKWFHLQCFKEKSTLRVSPKGDKPPPRIVYRYGKQD